MNTHASITYSRGARAVTGAVNFPLFLLIWSVGIVILTGAYYPADALVRQAPIQLPELDQLSSLDDEAALGSALEQQLQTASVFGGRWQPEIRKPVLPVRPAPLIEPELKVKTPSVVKHYKSPPVEYLPDVDGSDIAQTDDAQTDAAQTELPAAAPAQGRALVAKREARRAIAAGNRTYAYRLLISEADGGAADTEYLGLLAVSALSSGKAAEALLVYQRLLEFEPEDERWWAGLALSREHLGMNAAADYQEVLARGGADSPVFKLAQSRLKALG